MPRIPLCRYAAMNLVYNKYSFSFFLDSLQKLDIQSFELWTGAPHLFPPISSMNDAAVVRREVRARQLNIVCLTPEQVLYPYNIASENEELRRASVDYFLKNLEVAAELEVDKMLCTSGWGNYGQGTDSAFTRAIASLGEILARAETLGVTLAFEVLSTFESNLACNLEGTKRILDALPSPSMCLCVDTVAVNMGGNTLQEYLDAFGNRICHFHLTDGSPSGHVPLGQGDLPILSYIEQLENFSYEGAITLEIGDTTWCDRPHEATWTGFSFLRQILKKLQ